LIEANARGLSQGQKVYVHVVGLGLGVWMFKPQIQNDLYLEAFQQVLDEVDLPQISDVDFSWVDPPKKNSKLKNGETYPGKNTAKIRSLNFVDDRKCVAIGLNISDVLFPSSKL
jgi:hypothetical protein